MPNLIEHIETRRDLANFVSQLAREAKDAGQTWENPDLPRFLTALAAWIEDMDGYFTNRGEPVPETPEWRTFAQMLVAATVYE